MNNLVQVIKILRVAFPVPELTSTQKKHIFDKVEAEIGKEYMQLFRAEKDDQNKKQVTRNYLHNGTRSFYVTFARQQCDDTSDVPKFIINQLLQSQRIMNHASITSTAHYQTLQVKSPEVVELERQMEEMKKIIEQQKQQLLEKD